MLLASAAGGALSSLLLSGQVLAQGGDVVTASQVNIVDDTGRIRAVLASADERGRASVAFYGPDGDLRGLIGVEPDGAPVLRFNDATGASRLVADVRGGGDAAVSLGDQAGRNVLIGTLSGTPVVGLSHDGQARLQATLGGAGEPNLSLQGRPSIDLMGQPGQRALALSVDGDGAPFLSLHDATGAQRVAVGAVQGTAVVNLGDGTRPRLVLGVAPDGEGSVAYYDQTGTLVRVEGAATR